MAVRLSFRQGLPKAQIRSAVFRHRKIGAIGVASQEALLHLVCEFAITDPAPFSGMNGVRPQGYPTTYYVPVDVAH